MPTPSQLEYAQRERDTLFGSGALGEVLTAGGPGNPTTWEAPGAGSAPSVYAKTATVLDVTGTTSVVDLLGVTLTGGDVVAGDIIRVRMGGRYVNNSGGVRTFDMILSVGGTTLWQAPSNSNGASALYTSWSCDFDIIVVDATHAYLQGNFCQHATNTATVGLGAPATTPRVSCPIASAGSITIPTLASSRTLTFSVQHSNNSGSISLERYGYTVEVL